MFDKLLLISEYGNFYFFILFLGFWIRKLPSKIPIVKVDEPADDQGPMVLALAQKDVKEFEDVTTEKTFKPLPSSTSSSEVESSKQNYDTSDEQPNKDIIRSKEPRQKSIFEELVVSSSTVSSQSSSISNTEVHSFQTEVYKITDLFPVENINQTQNIHNTSNEDISSTQPNEER